MREVKLSKLSSQMTVLSMGVAAVLWSQAVSAAPAEDMPSTTLQTITVTANSSVRDKVQTDSVYIEDYTPAQQASHLSDFLNVVPGVTIGGTSSVNQRIRIRGLEDSNLKVTIDGARQEGKLFYHMGDITIDPDLLKQADVAVGNNSVTLGNDALGGAVAFKTVDAADLLKPGQKIGAKLKAGYASNNDELLTSATVFGAPSDNVDLLAYYGKRDTSSGEDGEGRELFEDSESESFLLKAGAYVGNDHHVGASFSRTDKEGTFPFRPDFPSLGDDPIPQKVKRDTYTLDYNFNPASSLVDVDTTIYQTETQISRDNDPKTSPGYDWDAKVKTTGGKIENTSVIDATSGRHKLIAGLEHYKKQSDFYTAKDRATKLPASGEDSAKNTSVYLEDQWQMGKFSLTPGVRYDRYEAPDFIAGGKTYDNVVGALAASYEIAPSTQVFASYTQLFNGPDLGQAIFNRDGAGTVVNNDLKAEEGDNAEVGVVTTLRDLTTANDSLQLSGKYFETNIENYIEFIRSGLSCGPNLGNDCQGAVNKDEDYKIKGVELAADYKMNNFSMGLSYAHARSKGEDTGYSFYSQTGSGSDAGDKYMVNLAYQPTDTTELGWRSTYVAPVTQTFILRGDVTELKKPSYDVHDIFMSYSPAQVDGLKATVGVYNLFDETYASHGSRLNPANATATDFEMGRNIKTSLTYQF
ncbi:MULTISPECIES: TonB-dependent receptor domain-containing protein [Psychrobacter]|uniref:TonB-dependent receptor domain-containing protein n=2 Tax=Moraxellaceae TaxID=468 RepID=UPI000EE8370F|nr:MULTISPECIES: TonB-dependent receptor [Psychrobacter]MBE8608937.1 TonB-dependent receptor [Pseudomonas lundensis]MCG3871517.1 TonB-dependent receptor [Psychrobacter sp. Ps7]HCI77163.1 TonB-dependent receptor [Psychrobacter sp.]